MNAHLRLDLEALGQNREAFYKFIIKGPVSCHNVFYITGKNRVDQASHQPVSRVMERSFIFREIGGGQSVPYHHISPARQNMIHHAPGIFSRIGVIPVDHQIAFCINIAEHAADYIAFALTVFIADDCPRLPGRLIGMVSGIVVININHRFRESLPVVFYHLRDCLALIVTGNQYCNRIHSLFLLLSGYS